MTSPQWTPDRLTHWEDTSKTIYSILSRYPHIQDLHGTVEDTRQETFIHAHKSLDTFDKTRGDFGAWIRQIAARCAYDHLRTLGTQHRSTQAASAELITTPATEPSPEELITTPSAEERLQDLATVLNIASKVLADPAPVLRVLTLILGQDPLSYRTAAQALDLSESTLRKSCSKVLLYTEVIYRALLIHQHRQEEGREDSPVLMQEVISCLPHTKLNKEPHFTHCITLATLEAGHVENIDVEALAHTYHWSYAYTQRCISRTTTLFNLALTIIQQGDI